MDTSLNNIDFEPLTEVKAKLSEKVARVDRENRLLAITLNGKPKAVLVPYSEFLTWLQGLSASDETPTLSLSQWEKESKQRKAVSQTVKDLFDLSILKRKGQKPYKKNALRKFKKT